MAANTNPIFPLAPYTAGCSLIAASAGTSRAPTAHASMGSTPIFAVVLTTTSTNGLRIDKIQVKAGATAINGATTAGSVIIWLDDGTTGWPIAEILTPVVTPSASIASLDVSQTFTTLVLKPTDTLWASTTIAGASAAHALSVMVYGGTY
jgi:hypothetical protein